MTADHLKLTRRGLLKGATATALFAPMVNRAWAQEPTTINMFAWYGHAEPDIVAEFEDEDNVKFVPKYYAGGDNMLALISQSPPGTFPRLVRCHCWVATSPPSTLTRRHGPRCRKNA